MKRSFRMAFILVGMLMLLTVISLFHLPKAYALYNTVNLPSPSWWNGDTCDSTHYTNSSSNPSHITPSRLGGSSGPSYRGLYPCGPMPVLGNPDVPVNFYSGAPTENEFECTELVKRYLYIAFGAPDQGSTDGKDVVTNYAAASLLFSAYTNNGTANLTPAVGDVLSFASSGSDGGHGHTAIVTATTVNGSGNGSITMLEQNNSHDSNGQGTLTVSSWTIGTETGYLGSVTGWLHPNTQVSTATTSDGNSELFGVKAIAANNVIAVGTSDPGSGHSNQALVEQWNGANWSVITSGNAADNDVLLYAVDANSASNIWAVGEIDNPLSHSYVLKYNGSSWSQVTSVPDIGALSAVKVFSSSNVWVAGQSGQVAHYTGGTSWTTYTPSNALHLYAINGDGTSDVWVAGDDVHGKAYVGQWTGGTNFTEASSEPNPANNSGDYDQITGIYAFASNNVWVSGFATPSSTGIQYGYVSHWNGSSWTNTTFSSGSTGSNLLGITAFSTSSIWAVGFTDTGTQVVHYNGSTWTSLPNASNGTLYGITSLGTNGNTWAIGYNNQTRPVNALSEFYN